MKNYKGKVIYQENNMTKIKRIVSVNENVNYLKFSFLVEARNKIVVTYDKLKNNIILKREGLFNYCITHNEKEKSRNKIKLFNGEILKVEIYTEKISYNEKKIENKRTISIGIDYEVFDEFSKKNSIKFRIEGEK